MQTSRHDGFLINGSGNGRNVVGQFTQRLTNGRSITAAANDSSNDSSNDSWRQRRLPPEPRGPHLPLRLVQEEPPRAQWRERRVAAVLALEGEAREQPDGDRAREAVAAGA